MKTIIVDGQVMNVYRENIQPHGWVGLVVGKDNLPTTEVSVPKWFYNGKFTGVLTTSGRKVQHTN
jgi:hypothetical protein